MVLGDGVRRDVAKVWEAERHRLRDAFIAIDTTKIYRDAVTYRVKQEKIPKSAHAARQHLHSGRVFLPGHREPDVGRKTHVTRSQLSPWPLVRRGDREHPVGTDRRTRRSAGDGLAGARGGGRT
jgi:hypothetical protein